MLLRSCSESIYKVPGDDTHFYGTFTTSTNGLMGSAICSFHIDAIQEAFRGKFKEQATSSSAWLPVLSNKVPEPRPGQCVNDTESLPDTVLNFIRSHPLMDSAISHENEKPVFYKRDVMFTRLVVDKLRIDFVGTDLEYTVYYAGSSKHYVRSNQFIYLLTELIIKHRRILVACLQVTVEFTRLYSGSTVTTNPSPGRFCWTFLTSRRANRYKRWRSQRSTRLSTWRRIIG